MESLEEYKIWIENGKGFPDVQGKLTYRKIVKIKKNYWNNCISEFEEFVVGEDLPLEYRDYNNWLHMKTRTPFYKNGENSVEDVKHSLKKHHLENLSRILKFKH